MNIQERITSLAGGFGRRDDAVRLLAVSKKHSAEAVVEAARAGQRHFGESFVSEALEKQQRVDQLLSDYDIENNEIEWHFIGRIQSNKARQVAQHFSWVHSLDRDKTARRLDRFRGPGRALNVLIQVNLSDQADRAGVPPDEVLDFAAHLSSYARLNCRGLMAMAPATDNKEEQMAAFARVKSLFDQLRQQADVTELSMGMSNDLEAAIANGATWVRIGTDVFGKRPGA